MCSCICVAPCVDLGALICGLNIPRGVLSGSGDFLSEVGGLVVWPLLRGLFTTNAKEQYIILVAIDIATNAYPFSALWVELVSLQIMSHTQK